MKLLGRWTEDGRLSWNGLDASLLLLLFLFNALTLAAWPELSQVGTKPWLVLLWLYGIVSLLPLLWRDRAPVAVFAIQCVLTLAAWPIQPHYAPFVGVPAALYAVAVHRSRTVSLLALLVSSVPLGLVATVAFRVIHDESQQFTTFLADAVFVGLVAVGAWGSGRLTNAGRQRLKQLEQEQQTARQAVAVERARIARQLHDIVSHAVTVIVLQAAGAARVVKTDVDQVTRSLGHIEATGKQAMAELRRLLGVLDPNPAHRGAATAELGPQPALADLPALLDSFRATGMTVTVETEGPPCELDPSVNLAAYRIVQEGLTNILKHADRQADPRLRLQWERHTLLIQLDNNTNGNHAHQGKAPTTSRGLVGLRERANAVGGSLRAAPTAGGYRLSATLPISGTPRPIHLEQDEWAGAIRRAPSPTV